MPYPWLMDALSFLLCQPNWYPSKRHKKFIAYCAQKSEVTLVSTALPQGFIQAHPGSDRYIQAFDLALHRQAQ